MIYNTFKNKRHFVCRFYRQSLTVRLEQTGFHLQFLQETGSSEEVAAYLSEHLSPCTNTLCSSLQRVSFQMLYIQVFIHFLLILNNLLPEPASSQSLVPFPSSDSHPPFLNPHAPELLAPSLKSHFQMKVSHLKITLFQSSFFLTVSYLNIYLQGKIQGRLTANSMFTIPPSSLTQPIRVPKGFLVSPDPGMKHMHEDGLGPNKW